MGSVELSSHHGPITANDRARARAQRQVVASSRFLFLTPPRRRRLITRVLTALTLAALALSALLITTSPQPAQAQAADNPEGVLWQAKITPAQHSSTSLSHINGWSHGAYGSIDGSRTFTDGGATFTLNWVAHRDGTGITDSTGMLLRMSVNTATAFGAATLCAGDVSVPIPARNSATSHDFAITDSSVTATPPWTNGVAVGGGGGGGHRPRTGDLRLGHNRHPLGSRDHAW